MAGMETRPAIGGKLARKTGPENRAGVRKTMPVCGNEADVREQGRCPEEQGREAGMAQSR